MTTRWGDAIIFPILQIRKQTQRGGKNLPEITQLAWIQTLVYLIPKPWAVTLGHLEENQKQISFLSSTWQMTNSWDLGFVGCSPLFSGSLLLALSRKSLMPFIFFPQEPGNVSDFLLILGVCEFCQDIPWCVFFSSSIPHGAWESFQSTDSVLSSAEENFLVLLV